MLKNCTSTLLLWPLLLVANLLCPVASANVTEYAYRIVEQYPHDPRSFTQGLEIYRGQLLESAGRYGHSSLGLHQLSDHKPLKQHRLSDRYFAEGCSELNGLIYQLTWKSGKVFVYDANSFSPRPGHSIQGEGWGLTNNGEQLIMSDGSNTLRFIRPEDFKLERTVAVTYHGKPVRYLNELEWIDGLIFANVWQSDWIIMIDPDSGNVVGTVNLQALRPAGSGVLNGIAYDPTDKRLFVTGKFWPLLYEIELQALTKPAKSP